MRIAAVWALLTSVALAACGKPSEEQCDLGCRNYYKLHYWDWAEAEIASAPEAERAELRKRKVAEFDSQMQRNLGNCVMNCRATRDKHCVKCWIDARTAREARACENE